MNIDQLPFVSVIVPVYNDAHRIVLCIESLLAQTYPRERYEVLVVDNGSTDGTVDALKRLPVTLLAETQTRSSYAARNKGLAHAKGTIIAFTDSDCTPVPQWIEQGVRALDQHSADLVGGRVRFVYSPRPTGAEIFDSISNMQMEQGIRERGVAKTANLFVRVAVFRAIGTFPSSMQSGGDVFWTRLATDSGYTLVYAHAAEVAHPTRRLGALLKKQYRVGRGHNAIRATERAARQHTSGEGAAKGAGQSGGLLRKMRANLKSLRPTPINAIRQSMQQHQIEQSPLRVLRVWAACWLANVATTAGSLAMAGARTTKALQRAERTHSG